MADKIYYLPVTPEYVKQVIDKENPDGISLSFGGQTALNCGVKLHEQGHLENIKILGSSLQTVMDAEDRERFKKLLYRLGLKQPDNGIVTSTDEAEAEAVRIGFPVVIRPSYVLGGRAMEIVHDVAALRRYMGKAVIASGDNPVLIDRFLSSAIEVDVDCVADGMTTHIAGIMEHIEEAGIHSGDSACALPPQSLTDGVIEEIRRQTTLLAKGLSVRGLMNIQFAVKEKEVFLLEVNPRTSRTVPFVAKATGVAIAKIAARVMAGEPLASFGLRTRAPDHVAVKEAVFPFTRFPGVDSILGPEMKSTGEVMGIDPDFAAAFAKSQIAAGNTLPSTGTVFVSVRDGDKPAITEIARELTSLGFLLLATSGTAQAFKSAGLRVDRTKKVLEGRPHIVDKMLSGDVDLVINTTAGAQAIADSFSLRRTALTHNIPYYTTVEGARAAVKAISAIREGQLGVAPLQSYLSGSF